MDVKKIKIDTSDKKFRLKSGKYFLSFLFDHFDKDQLIEYYDDIFKENRFIRCAHYTIDIPVDSIDDVFTDEAIKNKILDSLDEEDEKFEMKITYMLIDATGSKMDIKNPDILNFEEVTPIVEKIKSVSDFDKVKVWFGKIDPSNSDLRPPRPLYELVAECKTLKEALIKYANDPKDIGGIKQLFEITRRDAQLKETTYTPTLPWQLRLLAERINVKPDYRKITWYYDPVGDSGKTSIGRYLRINYPSDWMSHNDLGTMYHASTIITNDIQAGWTQHGICINLTRGAENHKSFYQVLESIKDGQITAMKYSGGTTIFNSPHLIVFSNFLPKVQYMSKDRWDIREITQDKDDIKISVERVLEIQREERAKMMNGEFDEIEDGHMSYTHDIDSITRAIRSTKSPEFQPVFKDVKTINVKTPTKKTKPVGKVDPNLF